MTHSLVMSAPNSTCPSSLPVPSDSSRAPGVWGDWGRLTVPEGPPDKLPVREVISRPTLRVVMKPTALRYR